MTYCCFVLFRFFSHDSLLLLAGSCNRGRRSKSGTRGKTCTRWVGLENHYSSFFAINKVTKPSVRVQFWWSSFWLGTRHLSPAGGGSEDFGRVTIKWIWSLLWSSPPPPPRSQFIESQFSPQPPFVLCWRQPIPLNFPWKPCHPPRKKVLRLLPPNSTPAIKKWLVPLQKPKRERGQ